MFQHGISIFQKPIDTDMQFKPNNPLFLECLWNLIKAVYGNFQKIFYRLLVQIRLFTINITIYCLVKQHWTFSHLNFFLFSFSYFSYFQENQTFEMLSWLLNLQCNYNPKHIILFIGSIFLKAVWFFFQNKACGCLWLSNLRMLQVHEHITKKQFQYNLQLYYQTVII